MNEREKLEFENHKKRAEEQLNSMYYGTKKKDQDSGLKMPSFLTSPKNQYNNGATNNPHSGQGKKNQMNQNKPAQEENIQSKKSENSKSILNFLNFKGMTLDNDRLIIIAICLLLGSDDVDELLMLALIYIML